MPQNQLFDSFYIHDIIHPLLFIIHSMKKLLTTLFSFKGRATRTEFWVTSLVSMSISIVTLFLVLVTLYSNSTESINEVLEVLVATVAYLLILTPWWIYFAVTARRFHDRGKSGWMTLLHFLPAIGFIWIIIECGFLPSIPSDK